MQSSVLALAGVMALLQKWRMLSIGRGCWMPCFLFELSPLAWSQPLVKSAGKMVCRRREGGRRARMTFCSACARSDCQLSAFPQAAFSPNPSLLSPNPSTQSEGCGVSVAPAAAKLGSRVFPSPSSASWAASLPAPRLPHSPPNIPLWLMGMVRDKWLTDSSVWGADRGIIWIEAANQTM